MKEDAYTKSLAKNQVCAIFYMRVIWENVFYKEGDIMGGGGDQYRNIVRKLANTEIPC